MNSNSYSLAALAREAGAVPRMMGIVGDTRDATIAAIEFQIDGQTIGSEDTSAPYQASLDASAYTAGEIAFYNDQPPPELGQAGDVRLAGFSGDTGTCGPSGFCLVLDGAAGGSNATAILALLAAIAGLYFVWLPTHATRLAALVGIGRGVDLIIYIWVVISLILLLNLHLKLRSQAELITILMREIAVASARTAESSK